MKSTKSPAAEEAPVPLSIEEQLTAALSNAGTLQASIDSLTAELGTVKGERDSLTGQFESLTTEATQLRSDLDAARASITSLTTERDAATTDLAAASANVSRLEALCGVKGINSSAAAPAVPEVPGASSEHVFDQWQKAHGAEKTRLWRAHRSDIRAEGERRMANPRV